MTEYIGDFYDPEYAYLNDFTDMIPQCQYYEDGFLLLVATLSNLTFLESASVELMRRHRTLARIIAAIKSKPDFSIFVLDHVSRTISPSNTTIKFNFSATSKVFCAFQFLKLKLGCWVKLFQVSTILANAAGSERCRKEIIRCGGVVTLLCFIQQRPSPFESAAEIAACERLQQRSTVAISRYLNSTHSFPQQLKFNSKRAT